MYDDKSPGQLLIELMGRVAALQAVYGYALVAISGGNQKKLRDFTDVLLDVDFSTLVEGKPREFQEGFSETLKQIEANLIEILQEWERINASRSLRRRTILEASRARGYCRRPVPRSGWEPLWPQ